jgi:hypothetical protein
MGGTLTIRLSALLDCPSTATSVAWTGQVADDDDRARCWVLREWTSIHPQAAADSGRRLSSRARRSARAADQPPSYHAVTTAQATIKG